MIVHQENFVGPVDPEVHMQNVENMIVDASQFGISDEHNSYLNEFIWRQTISEAKSFQHLLALIARIYVV